MTTTVTVSVSAAAPQELLDHLEAFARDLDHDGITVTLDLLPGCTACGCTDDQACEGGCSWVNDTEDLCSRCAGALTHTEHTTVETWNYACVDGACDHLDGNGEPVDNLSDCPSTTLEVCIDCMQTDGYTRDEENWDFVPLTTWPCENGSEGEDR